MRKVTALSAFACWLAGSLAHGEIAVMEGGKILYIDRYHREDKLVTMFITGGGEVTVPSELVARIVPNEILPQDQTQIDEARIPEIPLLPQLSDLINPVADHYGLDPRLVAAVIWVESSGDPNAVSRTGAQGLMQLMPQTARALGVQDAFDPAQNLDGGARYLKSMLEQHEHDLSLALAAYNAGPAAVAKYGGIPPYKETQHYVERILGLYQNEEGAP